MKSKILAVILACAAALCCFAGCDGRSGGGAVTARVYAPDGAPAIGLAAMISEGYEGASFSVITPSDIGGVILKGDADIAIMPTNAAALTYGKGAGYVMAAVTNFGSLYLLSGSGELGGLNELIGKVVYSIGEGNVPDLVFRYLLKQANVPYEKGATPKSGVVSLAYVAEGSEFVGGLSTGKMTYGVISEPAATVALNKVGGAVRAFDIQKLYAEATGESKGYPQAALVVKKSFYESNPKYVRDFTAKYAEYVNSGWAENNADKALAAIKAAGSTTVPMLNGQIIKGCNLSYAPAAECKQQTLNFFAALESVKAEGETPIGKMPDDAFFM